jgi:hypothetical protein
LSTNLIAKALLERCATSDDSGFLTAEAVRNDNLFGAGPEHMNSGAVT